MYLRLLSPTSSGALGCGFPLAVSCLIFGPRWIFHLQRYSGVFPLEYPSPGFEGLNCGFEWLAPTMFLKLGSNAKTCHQRMCPVRDIEGLNRRPLQAKARVEEIEEGSVGGSEASPTLTMFCFESEHICNFRFSVMAQK